MLKNQQKQVITQHFNTVIIVTVSKFLKPNGSKKCQIPQCRVSENRKNSPCTIT